LKYNPYFCINSQKLHTNPRKTCYIGIMDKTDPTSPPSAAASASMDKNLTISWGLVALAAGAGAFLFSISLLTAALAVTAAFAGFKAVGAAADYMATSKETGPAPVASLNQPVPTVAQQTEPDVQPSLSSSSQWRDRVTAPNTDVPSIEFSQRRG
jgi:hypothetical protein